MFAPRSLRAAKPKYLLGYYGKAPRVRVLRFCAGFWRFPFWETVRRRVEGLGRERKRSRNMCWRANTPQGLGSERPASVIDPSQKVCMFANAKAETCILLKPSI